MHTILKLHISTKMCEIKFYFISEWNESTHAIIRPRKKEKSEILGFGTFLRPQVLPTFSRFDKSSRLRNLSKLGKSQMNHISIYIIRREIQRWFRIWSQKFIFAYAFKRKSRFKKFAWANQKNLMCIESALKFQFEICAYVDTCVISNSRIAHVQKIDFS